MRPLIRLKLHHQLVNQQVKHIKDRYCVMVIGAIYAITPSNEIKKRKKMAITRSFEQFLFQNNWATEALWCSR